MSPWTSNTGIALELVKKADSHTKRKENLRNGGKYLQMMQSIRASFPKYTNSSYSLIITTTKKTNDSIKKNNNTEDLNRKFSKEDI